MATKLSPVKKGVFVCVTEVGVCTQETSLIWLSEKAYAHHCMYCVGISLLPHVSSTCVNLFLCWYYTHVYFSSVKDKQVIVNLQPGRTVVS